MAVTTCSAPDGAGHYRVIVFAQGFEHVSSAVYLQWLEWNEDGPRVIESTLVAKLSSGLWSVGTATAATDDRCSMQLDATHTYNLEAAHFILQPGGVGRYSIREVSSE